MDLDLKLYSPLSFSLCAYICALTPGRLQALQLSFPPHATPLSTTPPLSLLPSLLPSQEARQHEWQAGAGGGIWGLLAKRQTGAAPLESLKWQTLKRVGGETEEDENIPQDEQATEFCTFPFFFVPCQKRYFSSFLLSCRSFLQVLLQRLRTVDHFLILLLLPLKALL